MAVTHAFFATTAKGLEAVLAGELRAFAVTGVEPQRAGVAFRGPLESGYRACLWSRVASRVLLPLASFPAETPAALYAGVRTVRWSEHIGRGRTIAVDCAVSHSRITHSHFAALKTKDAIVDQLREQLGTRPPVAVERPDVRVNLYLHADRATVSIDLSGDSLHRRNYRQPAGWRRSRRIWLLPCCCWPTGRAWRRRASRCSIRCVARAHCASKPG